MVMNYSSYLQEWGWKKGEREEYIHMVFASARSPSLQTRLICCLSVPMAGLQETVATSPAGLSWWDVLRVTGWSWAQYFGGLSLVPNHQSRQPDRFSTLNLHGLCCLGGANQLEILQIGSVESFSMPNRKASSPAIERSCSELWLPDLPGRLGSAPW